MEDLLTKVFRLEKILEKVCDKVDQNTITLGNRLYYLSVKEEREIQAKVKMFVKRERGF